jgi:hypothetical protein
MSWSFELLSADADPFEIAAAVEDFALAMEDALAESYPWLLVEADDGGWRISAFMADAMGTCVLTARLPKYFWVADTPLIST